MINKSLRDRALDALDDAPLGLLDGEGLRVARRMQSVRGLAAELSTSTSAALRVVHELHSVGLVEIWEGLDATTRRRRFFISAEAS